MEDLRREERSIKIHTAADYDGMRRAGRLAAETLDFITPHVQPGVTTGELDRLCHDYIVEHGAVPAPLGYRGFPKSICTSVNHVVCHGIPGDKKLVEGDILNIDVTVILDGWHGDTSRMFGVGKIGVKGQKLIDVTYEAMMLGIQAVKPGATLGDIGRAFPWCGISAATAWARCSTTHRRSCITASRARASRCARACSSPSSR